MMMILDLILAEFDFFLKKLEEEGLLIDLQFTYKRTKIRQKEKEKGEKIRKIVTELVRIEKLEL